MNAHKQVIVFPFLPLLLRIFYALIALCITAASVFFYLEERQLPIVGICIAVITLLVIFCKDQWEFNYQTQSVSSNIGFLFWAYRRHYPFSAIASAETQYFTKGFFIKTPMMKCSLVFHTGEKKTVALFSTQHNPHLQQQWELLAKEFNTHSCM